MFCRQRLGVLSKQEELACSADNDLMYGVEEVGVWWLGRGCSRVCFKSRYSHAAYRVAAFTMHVNLRGGCSQALLYLASSHDTLAASFCRCVLRPLVPLSGP